MNYNAQPSAEDVNAMKKIMERLNSVGSGNNQPPSYNPPPQPLYEQPPMGQVFDPTQFYTNNSEFDLDSYYASQNTNPVINETVNIPVPPPQTVTPSVNLTYTVAVELIDESKASNKYMIVDSTGRIFKSGMRFKEAAFAIKSLLESGNYDEELLTTLESFDSKYTKLTSEYKVLKTKLQSYAALKESVKASDAEHKIRDITNQIKDLKESLIEIKKTIQQ